MPSDAWEVIANSLRIFDRELQIIQGIFDDQKEFAIADELTMSIHTVHTHLERLYRTLGVSSRVGLVLCILSEYFPRYRLVSKLLFSSLRIFAESLLASLIPLIAKASVACQLQSRRTQGVFFRREVFWGDVSLI